MASSKRQPEPARQILFVLGMHRSGTSALSGVLTHLGARAPRSLMAPTKDNPKGYWESSELMKLHDRILSSAGSRWNDWSHFNPDWIETGVAASFRDSLLPLLEREYGDAPLLLVKDPRISRFFPLWRQALEGTAFTPKVVLSLRHPDAVAGSLAVRNTFGRYRSVLLWLRHMLDAEAASRDLARSFVQYDALLDDWQAAARKVAGDLGLRWPAWSGDSEARIDEFLSSELRHHAAPAAVAGSKEFEAWADTAYACLVGIANGEPEAPRLAELDRIRNEFDRTSAIYAAVVREHETRVEGLYAKVKAQLAEATGQAETLSSRLADMQGDLERTTRALAERESALLAQQAHAAEQAARAELQHARQLDAVAAFEARLAARQAERDDAIAASAALEARLEAETGAREAAEARLAEAAGKAGEQAAALEDARAGRQRAEASLAERFAETGKLTEMVFRLEESLEGKDREIAAAAASLRGLEAEHEASLAAQREQARQAALDQFRLATLLDRVAGLESRLGAWRADAEASRAALDAVRRTRAARLLGPLLRIPVAPDAPMAGNELAHAVWVLRQSDLFDADWYRATYLQSGDDADPVVHYLREGAAAGYNPGPAFDTVGYLVQYPDLRRSSMNPLVHYLEHGRAEGRRAVAPAREGQ